MAKKVGAVSQKGGVGKSGLIRLVAREFATAGWQVKICDFDIKQGTCVSWKIRREQHALEPEIAVETFRTIAQAERIADSYDLLLYDGQPHSTAATLEIARNCDKILLPTGLSRDDLIPSVLLAHELAKEKILLSKFAFVLCRVGDSENEIIEARSYIKTAGYTVLEGELPEKTGYRRALDDGRAFTEATHPSLRLKAEKVAQSIVDFITND
jgi:chromosome partitioning protein